ncbi:MAG TPA: lipoate--protein ligase family protein [Acidimicrobiia bacterium]|nr:lipoate--protein ligase family protein [Acidimicrobiia bacterium]
MTSTLDVLREHHTGDGPLDTAVSRAILHRVNEGELGETLEVGAPHHIAAFGKHDTLTAGFDTAVTIAEGHGYDPTIRIAGGRAVVFSPTIVRFAWTIPSEDPARTMHERFRVLANGVVSALASLGITSAIGEIPNEYCAGEYSVSVLGARKVMGVGQRLSRSAAQIGGMIVVADPDDINTVLVPIYDALGVRIDPSATGSLADVASVTVDDVLDALTAALARGRATRMAVPDPSTLDLARHLRPDHDPAHLQTRR